MPSQEKTETQRPNYEGIPCYTSETEKLRNAHNEWESYVSEKVNSKEASNTYWKDKSACVSL